MGGQRHLLNDQQLATTIVSTIVKRVTEIRSPGDNVSASVANEGASTVIDANHEWQNP